MNYRHLPMKTLETFGIYSIMSPFYEILSCILILYMFQLVSAASESGSLKFPSHRHYIPDQKPRPKPTTRLSNPLVGDDRKIYMCLGKNLMVFQNNGFISRTIPLGYKCNITITPVLGASRKVYLVAENRVLKINTMNSETHKSVIEVFLGPETGVDEMNEIIGISVSISSSCVLVNIKENGLFAYSYEGKLKWSTGPVHTQLGYHQGCRLNITGCYFTSVPVIDHCDANVYMWNNQGELYAVSMRTPQFKWIQDFSSLGKRIILTAGNNGKLYLTVPDRSIVLGLDVETGTVLWKQVIGPLNTLEPTPVSDVNGWFSIGSLDGFLYSISPSGILKKYPRIPVNDTVIEANAFVDCSGYAVYIAETKVERKFSQIIGEYNYVSATKPVNTTFKLLIPATGSVYWNRTYPGSLSDLFLSWSDLMRYVVDENVILAFLSVANNGSPLPCYSSRQKLATSCSMMETKHVTLYTGNEKAITLFLFFETNLLIILSILVRFCCVFWKKKKVQKQDLGNFLEKRSSLRIKKKVFDRTITELQKKASTNEVNEKLRSLVREREGIERKLSTTYSLGKDTTSPESKTLIPLSDKKSGKFSLRSGKKESVAIFHAISNSCSEDGSSSSDDDDEGEKGDLKMKAPMEIESFSDDDVLKIVQTEVKILDEGNDQRDLQSGGGSMRKRPLSLTRNISNSK